MKVEKLIQSVQIGTSMNLKEGINLVDFDKIDIQGIDLAERNSLYQISKKFNGQVPIYYKLNNGKPRISIIDDISLATELEGREIERTSFEKRKHISSENISLTEATKNKDKLELDYSLKVIGIADKVMSFIEWYKEDLIDCAIKDIPQPFEEGYITILNIPYIFKEGVLNKYIKEVASKIHRTYNQVKESMEAMYKVTSSSIIIHYKFIDGLPDLSIYSGTDYMLITKIPFRSLGTDVDCPLKHDEINIVDNKVEVPYASCLLDDTKGKRFQDCMTIIYYALFISSMWYMALHKNRTKYEKVVDKDGMKESMFKRVDTKHNNSNIKTLRTSFYDLSKAHKSKVSTLKKKREGFTFSHQFGVQGHYRHYKSGKVSYINPYIKCKDKPKLETNTYYILEPKS